MRYRDYLKTDDWQKKRSEALTFWGGKCWVCESKDRLHVHHIYYYRDLAHCKNKDFRLLCEKHHHGLHEAFKLYLAQTQRSGWWRLERFTLRWCKKQRKKAEAAVYKHRPGIDLIGVTSDVVKLREPLTQQGGLSQT